MQHDIALIGMGVMGRSLAIHMTRKGWNVAVFDSHSPELVQNLVTQYPQIHGYDTLSELIQALRIPRKIMLMITAGQPIDDYLQQLPPHLAPQDIIIDGGNSHFRDTQRRVIEALQHGIHFLGVGISGGEQGALHGASIMPGGALSAWQCVADIFQDIAAKTPEGVACCRWLANDGAGHFVKMVHNGIEYALMQIICEAYHLMRQAQMTPGEIAQVFAQWNQQQLSSYLLEITTTILRKLDEDTQQPLIDLICDAAAQKGTGQWSSQIAMELGVAIPTIAEATQFRFISSCKQQRQQIASTFTFSNKIHHENLLDHLYRALLCSMISVFSQGFALLTKASEVYQWHLKMSDIVAVWSAGCIIRAGLLQQIEQAFQEPSQFSILFQAPEFAEILRENHSKWRYIVAEALLAGSPVPGLSSALSYFDCYRHAVLPSNLIQAQRDYFGSHGYRRNDQSGNFHSDWK